jgi:hypothetical protein
MKIFGEWRYSSIILNLGTRLRWVVSFIPRPFHPRYRLERRLGGPQAGLGAMEKRNLLPLSGIEPRPSLYWLSYPGTSLQSFKLKCYKHLSFPQACYMFRLLHYLDSISIRTPGEQYKLWSSSFCNFRPLRVIALTLGHTKPWILWKSTICVSSKSRLNEYLMKYIQHMRLRSGPYALCVCVCVCHVRSEVHTAVSVDSTIL